MKKEFHIYSIVTGQEVTFIGCTKGDLRPGALRLQTVSEHPKANWVKWCVRFRRTLKDRHGVEDPLAEIFTNPLRLKRLLDAEAVMQIEAEKCKGFLAFHSRNPHVLADIVPLHAALGRHDLQDFQNSGISNRFLFVQDLVDFAHSGWATFPKHTQDFELGTGGFLQGRTLHGKKQYTKAFVLSTKAFVLAFSEKHYLGSNLDANR
jgi:hypothetical protein